MIASARVNEESAQVPAGAAGSAPASGKNVRTGLLCGLAAYTAWGFIPLYFHAVADVAPAVVLCHRIFWSALFLVVVISLRRQWTFVWPVLRNRRSMVLLLAAAGLIAVNWLIFIYAVVSRQVLQASLGYFINPLLSIFLGMLFLHERLRRLQWAAVLIAGMAVLNLALRSETFPWIALSLAASFGFYGLVRKKVDLDALRGLLVETMILLPASLVFLAFPVARGLSPGTLGLLSLSGIITAVPLLFFGVALRRLKLSTMGFLQYTGPTLQFLVAVVLFHEPLGGAKLASFALCWLAIAVYVTDSVLARLPQECADKPE
jgi:chloramphenicol-sensitive protein RarD